MQISFQTRAGKEMSVPGVDLCVGGLHKAEGEGRSAGGLQLIADGQLPAAGAMCSAQTEWAEEQKI